MKVKIKFAAQASASDDRTLTIKFKVPKKWRSGPVSKLKETFLETFNEKFQGGGADPLVADEVHLVNSSGKALPDSDVVEEVVSSHDELELRAGAPPVTKLYLGHKVSSARANSSSVPKNAGSTSTKSSGGFDYSRFDNIDVSDEEEDKAECHPNIDVKSWVRLRQNQRAENRAKERAEIAALESQVDELKARVKSLDEAAAETKARGDASEAEIAEAEAVARDVRFELEDKSNELAERIRKKKLTVDELCKEGFDVTSGGTGGLASGIGDSKGENPGAPSVVEAAKLEPGASGPVASEDLGYHEYLERHTETIDRFAHMNTVGTKQYDKARDFLLENPEILNTHAVGYMLLLCLDYMMAGDESNATRIATQYQLVQFCLDLAASSHQDPRSAVHPLFKRIDRNHDKYVEGFETSVADFIKKVRDRAAAKKAAGEESPLKLQREAKANREEAARALSEAEAAEESGEVEYGISPDAPVGPGGLHPKEVFDSLPEELQQCFITQDVEMIKRVLMEMKPEDAKYHFNRCIASGLWNPGGDPEEEEGDAEEPGAAGTGGSA